MENPPASSYPACIAVKTAELLSPAAGELYLRKVREAVMVNSRDISQAEELQDIARRLSEEYPETFDSAAFSEKFNGEESRNAFRRDLQQTRYNRIGRFPTLTMRKQGSPGIILTGYRPYEVLLQALSRIAPEVTREVAR